MYMAIVFFDSLNTLIGIANHSLYVRCYALPWGQAREMSFIILHMFVAALFRGVRHAKCH